MRRIAITGLGLTCAIGNNVAEALANAAVGKSGVTRCDEHLEGAFGAELKCRVGAPVVGFDYEAHVPDGYADVYDPSACFALAATAEALEDSGVDTTQRLGPDVGVLIGTGAPGMVSYHRALRQIYVERASHRLRGSALLQIAGNIPTSLIALKYKATGPTFAVANACASGATALSLAADYIRLSRCDLVIAGGMDAPITTTTFGSMLSAGAMNPTDDPLRACKPFSKDRSGLIVGEGAAILILEEWQRAIARGAKIYGELMGEAHTNEAHHLYRPDPTGESWANTMRLALKRAEVSVSEVDLVSAHAASTPLGDLAETRALKLLLADRAYDVPVSATKSMHGHTFGAAGAIETALAIGAMARDLILPTINLEMPDPECDLDYVGNRSRQQKTRVLLKNSFGFGGTNTSIVVKGHSGL